MGAQYASGAGEFTAAVKTEGGNGPCLALKMAHLFRCPFAKDDGPGSAAKVEDSASLGIGAQDRGDHFIGHVEQGIG